MRIAPPVTAFVLASSGFVCGACPLTPPAGLQGEMISAELGINGLPTAIYQVHSIESAERLVQETERQWRNDGYAPRRQQFAPWRIVSAAGGNCVSVLQLEDRGGGAQGFLSVSYPGRAAGMLDATTQRLLPAGTRVESAVRSKDHGRDGLTMVVSASRNSSQWADDLLQRLRSEKWQGLAKNTFTWPSRRLNADHVTAQSHGREFTAVIWGGSQTQAVITFMEPL